MDESRGMTTREARMWASVLIVSLAMCIGLQCYGIMLNGRLVRISVLHEQRLLSMEAVQRAMVRRMTEDAQ